jgi:hypothetical protein
MTYSNNGYSSGYASYGSPADHALRLAQVWARIEGSDLRPTGWDCSRDLPPLQNFCSATYSEGGAHILYRGPSGRRYHPERLRRHKQMVSKVLELSPKDTRAEIKRLKACIREIDETRIAPFEDRLRELLAADFDAAWASPVGIARNVAVLEIEALWRQIDQLNDALHGRRPRDVTIN